MAITSFDSLLMYFMLKFLLVIYFFFSSRRRHTRSLRDWSSDVCSSDLVHRGRTLTVGFWQTLSGRTTPRRPALDALFGIQIGRASCRERVENLVVAVSLKKNKITSVFNALNSDTISRYIPYPLVEHTFS